VTVFVLAMVGFFILGAAAQKELMSNRLQRNAQTPLLEVVRKIDAGEFRSISVSRNEDIQQIRVEIINAIIAMRPETTIRDLAECLLKQPFTECSPATEESSK
jgi:hypothetical protein